MAKPGCLNLLLALALLAWSFRGYGDPASIHNVAFVSDDVHLTSRINKDINPYSTSTDTVHLLMKELEYTQPVLNVPLARAFRSLDDGENVCVVNKIKTPEREEKYLYSLPLNVFHTQRLYQLADLPPVNEALLDEQGAVLSISDVLAAYPDTAIVLPEVYSYGQQVDADVASINPDQIIPIANHAFYTRFMQLFLAKRTDFALIFPAAFYRTFGTEHELDVRSYAISGNAPFVEGHILCSNTPIGEFNIAKIDTAIQRVYRKPEFLEAHTEYLSPSMREPIRQIIEHDFLGL